MGRVIVVVGLPGSGKSTFLRAEAERLRSAGDQVGLVAEDYMKDAKDDNPALTSSAHLEQLRDDIVAGKTCLIADVTLTEPNRRAELLATLADLPGLCIDWVFFDNNPEQCERNIRWDHEHKGRGLDHRLEGVRQRTSNYVVPDGFTPVPVGDASAQPSS